MWPNLHVKNLFSAIIFPIFLHLYIYTFILQTLNTVTHSHLIIIHIYSPQGCLFLFFRF